MKKKFETNKNLQDKNNLLWSWRKYFRGRNKMGLNETSRDNQKFHLMNPIGCNFDNIDHHKKLHMNILKIIHKILSSDSVWYQSDRHYQYNIENDVIPEGTEQICEFMFLEAKKRFFAKAC